MEQTLSAFVNAVNDVLWNKQLLLLFLLLGTGIYFTVRTRFIQVRGFGEGLRRVFGGFSLNGEKAGKHGMSSFQALTTAIAAQVGTGNITGCATALYSGGPGAIFWMWFSAFFGMATIYGEAVLAQLYKTKGADGQTTGGPIYYIRAAYKGRLGKGLAVFFSVAIILALGFMGNMVQSNSIGEAFYNAFGVPRIVMGVLAAAIAAFIFIGGVKRLASVTEKMVPIMAGLYIVGGLIVLFINREALPGAIRSIFVCAFDPQAVFGGVAGLGVKEAMRYGVARGLFSNESGMGSAPLVASAAQTRNPVRQALVSSTGTFWDTVVVCLMTGLVLVTTIMKNPSINMDSVTDGGQLTTLAFSQIPVLGPIILVVGIITFAWSTILGWSYYGERCAQYLWGKKSLLPYKLIFVAVVVVGPVLALDLVWTIADILNALMAIPNLIAVLLLSGVIAKETRHYLNNLDEVDKTEIPCVDK